MKQETLAGVAGMTEKWNVAISIGAFKLSLNILQKIGVEVKTLYSTTYSLEKFYNLSFPQLLAVLLFFYQYFVKIKLKILNAFHCTM